MDIIAKTSQYVRFDELKKGDIFIPLADGDFYFNDKEFYIKCSDDSAIKLTNGESRKIVKSKLCELIDCVLIEKETYTKLTEK